MRHVGFRGSLFSKNPLYDVLGAHNMRHVGSTGGFFPRTLFMMSFELIAYVGFRVFASRV